MQTETNRSEYKGGFMSRPYPLALAAAAIAVSGLIIYGTRLLPFAVFSRRTPGAFVRFVEKYIPSVIMAVLVVYCYKDVPFSAAPFGIPHIAGAAVTAIVHLSCRNAMASIFSGTAVYMVLSRLL